MVISKDSNKKSRWLKPEFCEHRDKDCDECKYFKNNLCALSEKYINEEEKRSTI